MRPGKPADYRDVVHPVRMRTRVFVVAAHEPCITMQRRTAGTKGRDYHTAELGGLEHVKPPKRWLMAAILCPGDATDALVAWLQMHRADAARIVFVLHPDTDAVQALRAWYAAGHPDPVVIEASTWHQMAAPLGMFVNDWIYADEKGTGWRL